MKRMVIVPVGLAALLLVTGLASGKDKPKQPHPNKATVNIQTSDNGCSGSVWANDTLKRTVKAHLKKDGTYRVRLEDKGTFLTIAATSPGNCAANKSKHGHSIRAGVAGTIKGHIEGTVRHGTFNPNATCTAVPCTKPVFIAAFFGSSATFSCLTENTRECKFKYDYHAKKNQHLLFRRWQNRGTGAGTILKEKFKGDIASS